MEDSMVCIILQPFGILTLTSELGTMNFVISFAVLLCVPIGGIMLEHMGAQALAGLYLAIVVLGGGCFFAARALLIGEWFSFKTII